MVLFLHKDEIRNTKENLSMEYNVCPNCGAVLDSNSTFCSNCGNRISSESPAPQQPAYQQPAYQQPAYQQPVYGQPVMQQYPGTRRVNGFGIAGMILGISAFAVFAAVMIYIFYKYDQFKDYYGWWGYEGTFGDTVEVLFNYSSYEGVLVATIFSSFLAFSALPFSIVGLCLRNRSKGTAATGLALSIVVLVAAVACFSA